MDSDRKLLLKHIVLWGGWYGSHNVGDQALLLTITDILGSMLQGQVRFTVLTDNPGHVSAYTSRDSPWTVQPLHSRRQLPHVVRAVSSCDLLVFGGGVPFYEQSYHLAVMGLLVGIARVAHTPYMTWSVSSQAVQSRSARALYKWILNGAQALTCRDEHTRVLFLECGASQPVHISADPGFWLEAESDACAWELIHRAGFQASSRPLVALTPRTLCGQNGDAGAHYQPKTHQQSKQEIEIYAAVLDWLWEQGFQPIFVPMNTVPPDDDRIAASQVIQAAIHGSQAVLINEEVFPRLAPAIYRQCAFSVVSRVHGSITSFIGGCPPLMYAFDLKHHGIMASMHLAQYCLPEVTATPQNAIEMLGRLAAENDQIRQAMPARLEELRQEALVPAKLADQIMQR